MKYLVVVLAGLGMISVPHEVFYEHPELFFVGLTNRT